MCIKITAKEAVSHDKYMLDNLQILTYDVGSVKTETCLDAL